jgi:hypothetical protein
VGSEADGQGEPVKLAHILGKDSYDVLEKTVNPDLRKAFELLQASSLLVVGIGKVKECLLVPQNAFINALALPIPGFFMEPPKDSGNDNHKLLVENNSWNEIRQTGCFIFDKVKKAISAVGWQVLSQKQMTKEFRHGRKMEFDVGTTVKLFPIILLGGGDTEWVSCAIRKENMAGQHCNHCQRSTKDFIRGLGKPWTIKKLENAADHCWAEPGYMKYMRIRTFHDNQNSKRE